MGTRGSCRRSSAGTPAQACLLLGGVCRSQRAERLSGRLVVTRAFCSPLCARAGPCQRRKCSRTFVLNPPSLSLERAPWTVSVAADAILLHLPSRPDRRASQEASVPPVLTSRSPLLSGPLRHTSLHAFVPSFADAASSPRAVRGKLDPLPRFVPPPHRLSRHPDAGPFLASWACNHCRTPRADLAAASDVART